MSAKDLELEKIVTILKDEFHPKKLFLFGSRVNGSARVDSDYDFVVVVKETDKTRVENLIRTRQLFKNTNLSVDAFIYPEDEFNSWKDDFGSIPETALNTGLEIELGNF